MPRLLLLLLLGAAVTARAGSVRVGSAAPEFTLPDARGTPVSLADARGKVVCVEFWASWCPACRAMLPALDDVARRLGARGVAAIAVNIDERREAADRFLAERLPAPALRVVYDPGGAVMARFGASGMPALYVIDRRGVVRFVGSGDDVRQAREDLERAVTTLLEEQPP